MATEQTKVRVRIDVEYGDGYPTRKIAEVERAESFPHDLATGETHTIIMAVEDAARDAVDRASRECSVQAELASVQRENLEHAD